MSPWVPLPPAPNVIEVPADAGPYSMRALPNGGYEVRNEMFREKKVRLVLDDRLAGAGAAKPTNDLCA
jgi:hypothetical protein